MRKISRRSFLAASAAAAAASVLTACGASSSSSSAASSAASSTASSAASSAAAPAESYTIGICQLVEHEALDAATQGFQDALVAQFGDAVSFDMQNAQNDTATCATICNGFVSAGVDLIMANGTAALQAAQAATADIPILGTSITEYGVALGIDDFDGTVGGNVSGTSDLAPLEEQAAMIVEWMPEAKTAGLLYCSAEANSQYQVDVVQAELEAAGMTVTQYPFSDSNDLSSVCQQAATASDVLYVPTDNTVAANTGIVDGICRPMAKPVFAGEEGICRGCGVATLSISYYDLGYTTGEMAAQILTGEADISTMAIQYTTVTKKYNPTICDELGLTVPEGYEAIAEA
ncbi:MAG TPA: ABC transporter substrate-binding protein [Candidatus Faecalibacterium faecipullorum]|uniref:ABC transporter substrate-binding protein n=1 Tax=Candidatus Faecalibacterium faecipullorum TaxID=2838578 RepID=A0A9D2MFW3_9FIRM|nr:ABC transporter substrate-binding protein [Candidatus Faecalibacterium faecipullorum]